MSKRFPFWDVIEAGRKDKKEFNRILMEMSEQELVEFYWKHAEAEAELHEAGMADHMEEPVTDNGMSRMAEWIVDQGIDYYDRVFDDMSVIPRRAPDESRVDFRGQAWNVYRRRFGEDMRYPDEPPPASATKPKS
jgi:hypothetical protein